MYSRRTGRHSAANQGAGPSSSRQQLPHNRGNAGVEEESDGRSKKRKQHSSNGAGLVRGRRRLASEEVDRREEENEGDEQVAASGEVPEEEEVEVEGEAEAEAEEGGDDSDGGMWGMVPVKKLKVSASAKKAVEEIGRDAVKRKANDLVRLALFCEHRRVALKREDITKKVLDKASAKAFSIIFNRAQKVLRYTFGYEMVEVRARGTDNEQIRQAGQVQTERDEEDAETQAKGVKSRSYVLCSLLPAKVIAKMADPNASLAMLVNDVSQQVDGEPCDADGVMIDWKRASSELSTMGLLFLILSLILLNGRTISDDQLRSYLRRLSLDPHRTLPRALQPDTSKDSHTTGLTLDDYLNLLLKQSYLECVRNAAGGQGAMSMDASLGGRRVQARGKRAREEGEGMTGNEYEWRWGARAEAEITEKAVASFVADIYYAEDRNQADNGGEGAEQGEGENGEEGPSSRKKKHEQLLKHIEQVAGSQLIS